MIAIKLQGRLGNQLFQYAFIYTAAKKLNTAFYLDQTEQKSIIQNYFDLPFNFSFFLEDHIFSIKGYHNVFSYHLKNRYYRLLGEYFTPLKLRFEADAIFKEVIDGLKKNTCYEGFFLSESFFFNDKLSLKKIFTLKPHVQKTYQNKYLPIFKDKKIITVHIRKDDYLNLGHLNLGADDLSIPITYYHKILAKLIANDVLFVFISDNTTLIEQEFGYLDKKLISDDHMINDFQHLLHADICVIANSTFSWWGAWLNNKPNKKIYAPQYYMGHFINRMWPPDIYPEEWNMVDINGTPIE